MKNLLITGFILVLIALPQVHADCLKNQSGKLVCGKGQCETDRYGAVFCALQGGGAIKDKYDSVRCGIGYCAKDNDDEVWCSTQPGGSATVDSSGKVKCLGACEAGTAKRCQEAL